MKAYGGNRIIAPLILNFGAKWEWSQSRYGRFTSGKESHYSLCIKQVS